MTQRDPQQHRRTLFQHSENIHWASPAEREEFEPSITAELSLRSEDQLGFQNGRYHIDNLGYAGGLVYRAVHLVGDFRLVRSGAWIFGRLVICSN